MEPNKCLIDYITNDYPAYRPINRCDCSECDIVRKMSFDQLPDHFPIWSNEYHEAVKRWKNGTE
jgi:hypothetical protein